MHLLSELSLQEQEEVCVILGAFLLPQEQDDNDNEETAQKLRKELEEFVAPTTFDDKLLVSLLPPPLEYFEGDSGLPRGTKILGGQKGDITLVSPAMRALVLEKNGAIVIVVLPTTWLITAGIRLASVLAGAVIASRKAACGMALALEPRRSAAKAFLEWQGKPSQFFVLEGYKGKGKAKALVEDSEPTGAKELVDSDSDKEEEEDRVCTIKKIKREHVEELTGAKRRKKIMELDNKVEIVASKIPAVGPSCPASKPIVLVPSASKFVPKLIVTLASPLAGPSTAPIASSSAPKPVAAAALSKPAPAKSVGPAVKGFYEESGVLIINQATEVLVTQGTLHSEESGDEDAEGDDDDSDDGDGAMNIDSTKQPEETWPVAPIKTVTEVKAPVL
ncbi:hypothetical protein C0995_012461, partial [Termitomyces sp. Mi166